MVSSTGADTGSQPAYFGQILADLPGQYPQIKALVYFDAPEPASGDQYQLDAAGSTSFQQLAASSVFNPTRSPSQTTVSPSQDFDPDRNQPDAERVGRRNGQQRKCQLSGQRNAPSRDVSSFRSRLRRAAQTSQLAAGSQSITAVYSGDAAFSSSVSTQVAVTVIPLVTGTPAGGTSAIVGSERPGCDPTSGIHDAVDRERPADTIARRRPCRVPDRPISVPLSTRRARPCPCRIRREERFLIPVELANAPSFNAGLGSPVVARLDLPQLDQHGLVTQLDQVWAQGSIPMITWNCGDSDSNVASGKDDALISAVAQKLAATQIPIFLRWYPGSKRPAVGVSAEVAFSTCRGQ